MYRKVVLGWLCALALVLSPLALVKREAWAQQPGGAQVGPGSSFNSTVSSYLYGTSVPTAALSGCVGGGQSIVGNISAMLVTAGTGTSTTCTITWPVTRRVAPNCALTQHTVGPTLPLITVESTTVLTWTWTTTTASTVWDVICFGDTF